MIFAFVLAMGVFSQDGYESCEECEFEGEYVCASSGITYPSKCHAECADDDEYIEGICLKPCDCLDDYQPICGSDGRTY